MEGLEHHERRCQWYNIDRDLKEARVAQRLQSKEDLEELRQKAVDRDFFDELVDTVVR